MNSHVLIILAAIALAQCSPAASQAPPPPAAPTPTAGFVSVARPARVIAVETEAGARKSVFAQPTLLNGTALTITAAQIDCLLSNATHLIGDLERPLAPGATVIVAALPSQMADAVDIDEAFLPVISSCGLNKVVANGGRELVVTDGRPLSRIAEADLKAPEQGQAQ